MQHTMQYESPIGQLVLAGDGDSVTGLWMQGQKYFGATLAQGALEAGRDGVLGLAADWLDAYFAGQRPAVSDLPLAPAGSAFRRAVWDLLYAIPYGGRVTYGDLAREMAARMGRASMSSQAVGGAVGHNPISIIVPCHRVVGRDGSLTGYAGGIERKVWLLRLEGADMAGLYVPETGTAL